jgi:hypothetical protein
MTDYLIFRDDEDTVFTAKGETIMRGSASQTLQTAINVVNLINRWYEPKKPWYLHLWDAIRRRREPLIEYGEGKYLLDKTTTLRDHMVIRGRTPDETTLSSDLKPEETK